MNSLGNYIDPDRITTILGAIAAASGAAVPYLPPGKWQNIAGGVSAVALAAFAKYSAGVKPTTVPPAPPAGPDK